jgi:hypothetical protein
MSHLHRRGLPALMLLWSCSFVAATAPGLAQEKSPAAKQADAPPVAENKGKAGKSDQKRDDRPRFVRLVRDDKQQPLALETATVTYVPSDPAKAGIVVELVGAVHVGEKSYYEELNRSFEQYDALLYELVAPENTKIPKERTGPPTSAVGSLQVGMKEMLELEFQLDCVDYSKPNFVHADMSPSEFAESMAQRGESFTQMFFKMMGYGFSQQGKTSAKSPEIGMLRALFAKDRALQLKITMAEQFDAMEGQLDILDGPEGSTILTERNRKAFEVLDRELKAGKKKIGVFYGAAHLPDMEKRLLEDFGMKRSGERWVKAWALQETAPAKK